MSVPGASSTSVSSIDAASDSGIMDKSTCSDKKCRFCFCRQTIAKLAQDRYDAYVNFPERVAGSPVAKQKNVEDVGKGISTYEEHIRAMRNMKRNARLPTIMFQPHLDSCGFYTVSLCDEDTQACLKRVKKSFETISRDYDNVKNFTYPKGWIRHSTDGGRWESYPILNQGKLMEGAMTNTPSICKLLANLHPSWMQNMFGNCGFSVLYPNTVIKTHTGPCNIRIRMHLPLSVPEEKRGTQCFINVDGKKRNWKVGQLLLIDDCYPHSVTYTGPEDLPPRVIFYMDFWHPDVERHERKILDFIYKCNSKVVSDIGKHLEQRTTVPAVEKERCPRKCD